MVRGHATQFVFGVALLCFGCASFQAGLNKAATTYTDKISPATTQAVTPVLQIAAATAATTPVGSPANSAALLVTAIAGGILAVDKIILTLAGTIKLITGKSNQIPPVDTGANTTDIPPPAAVVNTAANSSLNLPGKGGTPNTG